MTIMDMTAMSQGLNETVRASPFCWAKSKVIPLEVQDYEDDPHQMSPIRVPGYRDRTPR